ncbi:hypothetical protein [Methylovirgula ligni]|uniref:hypothetical protein n=1 Tax=Methylovirgula ligni TaxID=569860 RepID=UPI0013ECF017|nr:hypothetical protein [Methylovirgula ligni]
MKLVIALVEPQPERRLRSSKPAKESNGVRHRRAHEKANIENPARRLRRLAAPNPLCMAPKGDDNGTLLRDTSRENMVLAVSCCKSEAR